MEAIIVGVNYYKMAYDFEESMKELDALANACHIQVKYTVVQTLDTINVATYIGKGKVEEIKKLTDDVDLVIFNEELTSTQVKNLSELLEIEVSDRTDLILKIFESRAKTIEAKLQVKIAKLQYLLPRLVGLNENMIGQLGGSGFRGSGEKQIELDRRVIYRELVKAKRELKKIVVQRQTQRLKRHENEVKVVALVGYTNSGKSSLMNYFVKRSHLNKQVFEKDMLFATLETSTRKVRLDNHKPFLLSDTVGFINQLPHFLVQAFRSTLEEVKEADLILLVVDSSSPFYLEHIETTKKVLNELEVNQNKVLYVYNKIDLNQYALIKAEEPHVFVSVKEEKNMDTLMKKINQILFKDDRIVDIVLPYDKMNVFSYLLENAYVHRYEYLETSIHVVVECSKTMAKYLQEYACVN